MNHQPLVGRSSMRLSLRQRVVGRAFPRLARGRAADQRGQSLVELALTIVFLLLLLSVIVDMGRAFFSYLALHNAAGEGALYGSAFPLYVNGALSGTKDDNPNNIVYRAKNESSGTMVNWNNTAIDFSVRYYKNDGTTATTAPVRGDFVEVEIRAPFTLIGPLPSILNFPTQIWMGAKARQMILAETS